MRTSLTHLTRFLTPAALTLTLSLTLTFPALAAPPQPLDPATALRVPDSDLAWYDATSLTVEGRGWAKEDPAALTRLPARAKEYATTSVWNLSRNTAGICLRFATDSTTISASWMGGTAMYHMPLSGSHGLDLYTKRDGKWVFEAIGRPKEGMATSVLVKDGPGKMTDYLLYLPLYHSVPELKIGVAPNASIVPAPPRAEDRRKPIVFYGTSITQGGCASRAGMCHLAILGRWLDREVINLGFSGSGKMEPELGVLFSELDAEVFVLECLPNMDGAAAVKARLEPFVRQLREKHPDMPIVLVENPLKKKSDPQNVALQTAFENLKKSGVKHLTLLDGEPQLAGTENGTVDGVHPTDLGFLRMAEYYRPHLEKVLGE